MHCRRESEELDLPGYVYEGQSETFLILFHVNLQIGIEELKKSESLYCRFLQQIEIDVYDRDPDNYGAIK